MASTAAPYGLRPVNLIGGQPFAGSTRQLSIASGYSTSIFNGDVVKLASGVINKDTGTATATPVGVFLGCSYTDPTFGKVFRQYWPANTVASDAVAYVCDDPDAVFQIQAAGPIAATNVGKNVALVQGSGSTASGNSGVSAGATPATTNTLPIRILGIVDGPDNSTSTGYTDILVKWNFGMHQYDTATGS